MSNSNFEQLKNELASGGADAVLNRLVVQLRENKEYHQLFEALKLQLRGRLGLPMIYNDSGDGLDTKLRDQLEDGLLDACREVGMLLLEAGNIREGWMYLRPLGEKEEAAKVIAKIEATEDNLDEVIEVTLNEGVDASRGFSLILENYGLCNSITTFESTLPSLSRGDQQAAAGILVKHVHQELTETVRVDISQQEGSEPAETTIGDLVANRPGLFGDHTYHLDTTHLSSTVRFARLLEDKDIIRLALDLTEYGRRLSSQYQYPGDEPFGEHYASHALYFQALLGENVDAALDYFRQKTVDLDPAENGTAAIEIYVDLLARVGKYLEAIEALISLMPADAQPLGLSPSLIELSKSAGQYDSLMEYYQGRGDLLGFAAGLVLANQPE